MQSLQVENCNLHAMIQQEDELAVLEVYILHKGTTELRMPVLDGSGRESHWFGTGSQTMENNLQGEEKWTCWNK